MKSNFAGERGQIVFLSLCVLGIILAAVFARTAGGIQANFSQPLSGANDSPGLSVSGSSKLPAASAAGQASGNSAAGQGAQPSDTVNNQPQSSPPSPPVATPPPVDEPLYPYDPPPFCKPYIGGIRAGCVYCDGANAGSSIIACNCYGGGGIRPEIMCASPL